MIVRVWGVVNSVEVEFHPACDKADHWEGIAPRVKGLQKIEIWAENDKGARGYLQCALAIKNYSPDSVILMLFPYRVRLLPSDNTTLL